MIYEYFYIKKQSHYKMQVTLYTQIYIKINNFL